MSSVEKAYDSSSEALQSFQCLERQLLAFNDHRAVFVTAYIEVLQAFISQMSSYEDPAWMEQMSVTFLNLYRVAFLKYEEHGNLPRAWKTAFEVAQEPDSDSLEDFLLGMNAHIMRDLPFALLSIGLANAQAHYRDYQKTNAILISAIPSILDKLEQKYHLHLEDPIRNQVYEWLGSLEIKRMRNYAWKMSMRLRSSTNDPLKLKMVADYIEAKAAIRAYTIRKTPLQWVNLEAVSE